MHGTEWATVLDGAVEAAPEALGSDRLHNEALLADRAPNEQLSGRIPAGWWGQAADICAATVFVASAASDYVHGVVLPVDGGWLGR